MSDANVETLSRDKLKKDIDRLQAKIAVIPIDSKEYDEYSRRLAYAYELYAKQDRDDQEYYIKQEEFNLKRENDIRKQENAQIEYNLRQEEFNLRREDLDLRREDLELRREELNLKKEIELERQKNAKEEFDLKKEIELERQENAKVQNDNAKKERRAKIAMSIIGGMFGLAGIHMVTSFEVEGIVKSKAFSIAQKMLPIFKA